MRATALLAAVCCLTPALVSAQDHRGIIDMQFEKAASAVAEQGFVPSKGVLPQQTTIGLLPAGGNVFLEVNLRAGIDYMVVGTCDYDCSDMDLAAYSAAGAELASDVELDDVPVVSFRADTSGPYLIEVSMPGCDADTCYFGFRVYND